MATGAVPIGTLPPGDYLLRGIIRLEGRNDGPRQPHAQEGRAIVGDDPLVTSMPFRRGRFWLAIPGAALLAFIVRVGYLAELQGSQLRSGLMGDSRQYDAWAQRIAGGEWMGTQVFYQAPLYPYFLAVVYTLFGHDVGLVRLIQAALGAASCALLGLAGRRFFSDRDVDAITGDDDLRRHSPGIRAATDRGRDQQQYRRINRSRSRAELEL